MVVITQTTPATKWESYAAGILPKDFTEESRRAKAIMLNEAGNIVLKDAADNQVTFTLAAGIPVQLRPTEIISTTAAVVIALFD